MTNEYKVPTWPINEQQEAQIREIVKKYASEMGFREGFEYRPRSCSPDDPILIQEYFRLFLTPTEVIWGGDLDPDERYFKDEKTLVDRIRTIVPNFASEQSDKTGAIK